MTTTAQAAIGAGLLIGIVGLAVIGERFAPPMHALPGGNLRKQACSVDAPEPLQQAAKRWCATGQFVRAAVKAEENTVVAVMQFTPNAAQMWQLQSGLLMTEFRNLTNQMAADAGGREIAVDLHDAADRRVGGCAHTKKSPVATCATK